MPDNYPAEWSCAMPKKKVSKEKSLRRTKRVADIALSLCLVGAMVLIVKGAVDRSSTMGSYERVQSDNVAESTVPTEAVPDPNRTMYSQISVDTKDKFYGSLILVNNQHQYFSTGEEDLVSILEMNDETGRDFFTAVDYSYTIMRPAYEPLAKMVEDFYNLYFNDTLIIYGSFRSNEFQQQLYDADLAETGSDTSTRVAKPGFSEHETGYAFDFSETVDNDYQGTGDFAWINENCYKYGFIVRYTEEKEDITEIRNEPWHFRYVGIPHAYYMTKNNLCLEEYTDLVRQHPYDGEHLEFTDDTGAAYEVYFYASDDGSDTTLLPVPSDYKYEVSGNNVDGFVVTVYKDEKVSQSTTQPDLAEPTTTEPAEETTEAAE